jgi:hypothetical protein
VTRTYKLESRRRSVCVGRAVEGEKQRVEQTRIKEEMDAQVRTFQHSESISMQATYKTPDTF